MSHTRTHRFVRGGRRLIGLAGVGSLMLVQAGTADARVNPYYVLESTAPGDGANTHILVLVDTSPTMSERADGTGAVCTWDECEDESSTGLSKIAAARYAIRQVVEATEGVAEFGFVGFQRHELGGPTPGTCSGGHRFEWVTNATSTHASTSQAVSQHGSGGFWRLCDSHADKEGFPYLRYDDAGTALPNDLVSPVTPISAAAYATTATMRDRGVQYFDEFHGVRFQPTAAQHAASAGDYSSYASDVSGNTFYYWPYVDGFPGYAEFRSAVGDPMGVNGEDNLPTNPLELYGPFFVELVNTNPTLLNPGYDGPTSEAEARTDLLESLATMTEGGVDLAEDDGWQWDNLVGSTMSSPLNSAAIFSSTSLDRYMTWMRNALDAQDEECGDLAIIIISDGINGWAGAAANRAAYTRLAAMYSDLNVRTYVIGFNASISTELNRLACAGSGACDSSGPGCDTPCDDTSPTSFETCSDPANPSTDCVWQADDPDALAKQFASIVAQILDVDIDSGQGAAVNTFGTAGVDGDTSQTLLRSYTEGGSWRGHVERGYCTDVDSGGVLLDYCEPPSPEFDLPTEAIDLSFGGCTTQTRDWDAGECLQAQTAGSRRLYTHAADHTLIEIQDGTGDATAEFEAELTALGLVTTSAEADAIAQFVSGVNAPSGWKLPGLANSSPVVVKRIPDYDTTTTPEVSIRDPHCGGRYYNELDAGALPQSLYDFAEAAWDDTVTNAGLTDYEYQEAVLVGDDMGVLHAFQLDSGNELWGFIPRGVLANLAAQAANGPQNMGQPLAIEDHVFGIASTVNHGWVHDEGPDATDPADDTWRHLAVFGIGSGGLEYGNLATPDPNAGAEYYALDISHMHPLSPDGPFEILWTTEDTTAAGNDNDLKATYDAYLGETWARPALSYWVPNDLIENPPEAFLVMGSGYAVDGAATDQGRTLLRADALTGVVQEFATLPTYTHATYETNFGALVDPAVGSHCISRFWAEAQETYIADPAGRLFRWDLGRDTSHAADSGTLWSGAGDVASVATGTVPYFPACTGTTPCTVGATTGDLADPFLYPPAVSANDRIDDYASVANGDPPGGADQFLVAMISGSTTETELADDYHSSIYLLVDNHTASPADGFTIPAGAPKTTLSGTPGAGTSLASDTADEYFRIALSDIQRNRVITINGTEVLNETANFSRRTRPIRAPRMVVTGVADDTSGDLQIIEGLEVFYVEFTVYEPPAAACNSAFVDADGNYYDDLGSTYVLRFRLTATDANGFTLNNGAGSSSAADFAGAGMETGLTLQDVEQVDTELTGAGNQGPASSLSSGTSPCEGGVSDDGSGNQNGFAIPIRTSTIEGFSPIE